jgi:putative addiction module killer protein
VVYDVLQTDEFAAWHRSLRDLRARVAIGRRLERACAGNLGDVKALGGGLSEMRVDTGAGYRVYFTLRDRRLVVLLCGGDKTTQRRDVRHAQKLLSEV